MLAVITLLVVVLQLAVIFLPFLSGIFDVMPLSACDLSIAASASVLVFVAMELEKIFRK